MSYPYASSATVVAGIFVSKVRRKAVVNPCDTRASAATMLRLTRRSRPLIDDAGSFFMLIATLHRTMFDFQLQSITNTLPISEATIMNLQCAAIRDYDSSSKSAAMIRVPSHSTSKFELCRLGLRELAGPGVLGVHTAHEEGVCRLVDGAGRHTGGRGQGRRVGFKEARYL